MLTLKRLLVLITTLLCALSIAACSSPSSTNAQAAGNSSNSGVSTTNEIAKETTQSQSQASKQTANQQTTNQQTANQQTTNQQTANQASTTPSAQVTTSVNNSQQASGQTPVPQATQSSQQTDNSQHNDHQATINKHQTPTSVNDSTNNNNSSNSDNSPGTNTLIKVAQVSINGQMTNVLTTSNGMTLYYDTNDSATNSTCTGDCAQTWHPFLAQGQIILSNGLTSGRVTQQATANGNQIEYNGHPLYTYVNDGAGQVNGQGVNNVWFAASMVTVKAAHW